MLNFTPISDRIVIAPDEQSDKVGSIFIPDAAKDRAQRGTVLAVGPGEVNDRTGIRIPLTVQPGDVVHFGRYSGDEVPKLKFEGREIVVMKEGEILGYEEREDLQHA